jgi:hypothetical protein
MAGRKYAISTCMSLLTIAGLALGLAAPAQAEETTNRLVANRLVANRLAGSRLAGNATGANQTASPAAGLGEGAASDIVAVQLADGTTLTR